MFRLDSDHSRSLCLRLKEDELFKQSLNLILSYFRFLSKFVNTRVFLQREKRKFYPISKSLYLYRKIKSSN